MSSKHPGLDIIFRRQSAEFKARIACERQRRVLDLKRQLASGKSEPGVHVELARQLWDLGEIDGALEILKLGLGNAPTANLYLEYVKLAAQANRTEEAITEAAEGAALFPSCLGLRLEEGLLLPVVYDSREQVEYYRNRFSSRLCDLEAGLRLDTAEPREDALSAVSRHNNFYLAYQMQDDRQLQERYARLVHGIAVARYPELEKALWPPASPDGRIRLGYVSASLKNVRTAAKHSVAKTFAEWISGRDPANFEIFVYNSSKSRDVSAERPDGCDHYRHLPADLRDAWTAIRADGLDALIFLDVGMNARLTPLSCMRLAPVQCVTWGHPVTTGSPNIDYFLSSDLMEPPEGDTHYTERLIRLPGIGMDYRKPFIPRAMLDCSRARFGFSEKATVYLCCQSTFKYLPDHDDVFARIAQRVPASQFVFLTTNAAVAASFRKRLERAFAMVGLDADKHCVLLPKAHVFDYWALNLASDVFLDSLEWSGCNSTMEAIACHLPVVTLPGRFMRGRHGYAILTQLGVSETIARDKKDYVEISVRLGIDQAWRKQVVQRMAEREANIYSDKSSTAALEQFLAGAVQRSRRMQETAGNQVTRVPGGAGIRL